jgi:GTPase SAR1 family protein
MFSVGSRGSFDLVETKFIAEIRSSCPDTPILLVGTKVDLYMSDVPKEQLVSLEEAQETARRNKLAGYLQLSSLADRGVQEMFHTALRLCWRFGGTNPEGSHETGNRKCAIQ